MAVDQPCYQLSFGSPCLLWDVSCCLVIEPWCLPLLCPPLKCPWYNMTVNTWRSVSAEFSVTVTSSWCCVFWVLITPTPDPDFELFSAFAVGAQFLDHLLWEHFDWLTSVSFSIHRDFPAFSHFLLISLATDVEGTWSGWSCSSEAADCHACGGTVLLSWQWQHWEFQ